MTKKNKKKNSTSKSHPKTDTTEIRGFLLCLLAIVLVLSLISFSIHDTYTRNWLGAVGNAVGWGMTALLGLSSYPLCLYLGWLGWRMIFKKPLNHLVFKTLVVSIGLFSACILLSLLEDQYPSLYQSIGTTVYAEAWERKVHYHLGGAPLFYIYHDLPKYNLIHIFNALGVAIIFVGTLLSSLALLAKFSPFAFFAKITSFFLFLKTYVSQVKMPTNLFKKPLELLKNDPIAPIFLKELKQEEGKPAQIDSDFLRYVKLRIPSSLVSSSDHTIQNQSEMLAIKPESNLKSRPSISRKELIDKNESKPPILEPIEKEKSPPLTISSDSPLVIEPSPKQRKDAAINAQKIHNGDFTNYKLPPLSLLTNAKKLDHSSLKKDLRHKAEVLEETLLSFGIEAKVGQINCGPTITSFEVHPAIGVKVQKIKTLENDIALNMEAKSIRIIAPIPGKAVVGIEVPNAQPEEVGFKEMLASYQQGTTKFRIPILLGKAVNGEYVMSDLAKMPHCIIAGATGSGKSVCINTIVMAIVLNAKPDEVKLVMVDPKKVELTPYARLPHMLAPVITEPQGACAALNWLVKEMEKRYEMLKQTGVRNIEAFNNRTIDKALEESLSIEVPQRLPYIVGIIDELADLMMVSSSDIETPIARIAQMARAVGIHLILATQRPSREVITGLIKANFPTRISFKVSSRVNSMIVLDDVGAETLLGNGDMLFLPPGSSHLMRAQGAFIRDEDINAVVKMICEQAPPRYVIESFDRIGQLEINDAAETEPEDSLYTQALDIVMSTGNASTTFLQRKLKIGYARAASLIDVLEQKGVVGPAEGSKPRKVFATRGTKENDGEAVDSE